MGTLISASRNSPAPGHSATFHRRRATAWAAAFGAGSAALVFVLAHRALGDDAYITLSYARNLAFHGHWGLTEFRPSNSATSPLNVWLLAALTFVVRAPVVACGLLLVLTGAAVGAWSSAIARVLGASWVLPTATTGVLLVNPLLVSTIGLETYLSTALTIGLVRYAIRGPAWQIGVVAGLAVLARPDLVVVDLVVVLGLASRKALVTGAVGALVALPWHVFSWFALGSAIPDTFAFKTVTGRFSDSAATMVNGLVTLYGARFPMATTFSVLIPVVGVMCLCGWAATFRPGQHRPAARVATVFAAAGLAHWAVLAFVVQADPYSWYYAPLIVGLTMSATTTFGVVSAQWAGTGSSLVIAGTVCWLVWALPWPWTTLPTASNWATSEDYARAGSELRLPPGSVVSSPGEIGTLAYFCRCDIVDWLSDRGRGWDFLQRRERVAGPVMGALLRWNYRNSPRTAPAEADYSLKFTGPGQQIADPAHTWLVNTPMHGRHVLVLSR